MAALADAEREPNMVPTPYFMQSICAFGFHLGAVVLIYSGAMLIPIAVSLLARDDAHQAFALSLFVAVVGGALLCLGTWRGKKEVSLRDGYALVTGAWLVIPAFAALPFMLYLPEMSFTDAYFEAMAGLTTTGATVMTNLDSHAASILMWRAVLQWIGGMGIIVLFVALLPALRVGGRQLYKAEAPGVIKDVSLTPRIAETAKGLWVVYAGLTLACALAYRLGGMSWMDAFAHAFTTLSLGGFSTHDASFGYFDSPLLEAAAIFFMLMGGINFATHFRALVGRAPRQYWLDREATWFLFAMIGGTLLVAHHLWRSGTYPEFLTALRFAAFQVVSVGTTTGYATTDYNVWPVFAPVLMLLLCGTAASAGSAGGGIKMIRTQLLLKQVHRELIRMLHPNAIVPIKAGGQPVRNEIVVGVLGFMTGFGATIMLLTLVLLATGMDLITAFTAIVACVTSTGPGLGDVGPATTYADLTDFQTWICSLAMGLGRLEIFTVLVLFSPGFWKR